jgi:hypothetical protein
MVTEGRYARNTPWLQDKMINKFQSLGGQPF